MGNNELSGLETELRLGLPGGEVEKVNEKKRGFVDFLGNGGLGKDNGSCKNQVVGWPPVCSYRMRKSDSLMMNTMSKLYVKVSMDGEPFLRKIDLDMYKGYDELVMALEKLFGCYGICDAVLKGEDNCEYVPIYEDKDGDWMLVGDVPWEMFIDTCKRLRIMNKSDAKFIATIGLLKLLSNKDE